jgi:hypothetical protein
MPYKDPERKKEASRLYHERKKSDPEYIQKRKENAQKFHEGYKNPNLTPEKSKKYRERYREKNSDKIKEKDREYKRKISQDSDYKAKQKEYREKNSEKIKQYRKKYQESGQLELSRLKHRYGITKEVFLNLLAEQKNCCCICLEPFVNQKPHVDHCHKTGKVRGLLHKQCNSLLGFAKDKQAVLLSAINYLNKHSNEKSNIESGEKRTGESFYEI